MNKVCLIGRITKDPEIRYTANNIAVATFSLAINRTYKNANGEYDADFINCIAFRNTADLLGKYVHKGDQLGIEGHIQTRNYDDKDGKKVYVTEVVVDSLDFLQNKREEKNEPKATETATETATQAATEVDPYKDFGEAIEISDDDLPF